MGVVVQQGLTDRGQTATERPGVARRGRDGQSPALRQVEHPPQGPSDRIDPPQIPEQVGQGAFSRMSCVSPLPPQIRHAAFRVLWHSAQSSQSPSSNRSQWRHVIVFCPLQLGQRWASKTTHCWRPSASVSTARS